MSKKKVKYTTSLFDGSYEGCFLCHRNLPTHKHEIFFSSANRDNSIRYGVWVNLCAECHNEVHFGKDPSKKEKLFKAGQDKFDEVYGVKKFGEVFSKKRFI